MDTLIRNEIIHNLKDNTPYNPGVDNRKAYTHGQEDAQWGFTYIPEDAASYFKGFRDYVLGAQA
jgi:hypothetical protein